MSFCVFEWWSQILFCVVFGCMVCSSFHQWSFVDDAIDIHILSLVCVSIVLCSSIKDFMYWSVANAIHICITSKFCLVFILKEFEYVYYFGLCRFENPWEDLLMGS